ncbi:hypothetical protein ACIHCQ_19255 [Streptomyces sp. NPDC052236]|uniref:hypothetical protein n=1 Tax=Streptomyces sp. NPDC052236 TaxID=3365686 RepID=UPI0037D6E75E
MTGSPSPSTPYTSILRNVDGNGCLDVPEFGHDNVPVQVYDLCWGGDNQKWKSS